ncbi:MAG: alcohol dehydrogenase catalytic domain-containing protein [Bryobacteraceae bacterium]|jgi:threonine dehydrogenase-like Zn-dependent dehydrogenase
MKTAIFDTVGAPLSIASDDEPSPGPSEVVIKIARCGICGSDLSMTDGRHGFVLPRGSRLGHEYCGEVVALGRGVERLKIGDRIASMPAVGCGVCEWCAAGRPLLCPRARLFAGRFAEYLNVGERESVLLPGTVGLVEGALIEPLAVALHGIRAAHITNDTRVVVIGPGPIGLGAIFWGRKLGAKRIAAIGTSVRRRDMALIMGADAFLLQGEGLTERLHEVLGGTPHVIIETVGATDSFGQAMDLVRNDGRVISLGICSGPMRMHSPLGTLKELTVIFSFAYSLRDFLDCVDMFDAGAVTPQAMVTGTISLDQLPQCFEDLRSSKEHCKVHVLPH